MLSSKSKQLFNHLSDESQGWLTACLDPFHDFTYEVAGLPDQKTAPSVVQIHNQTYSLTAPPGCAGSWDAMILYTGFNSYLETLSKTSAGGAVPSGCFMDVTTTSSCPYDHTISPQATGGAPPGALLLHAVDAGTPFGLRSLAVNHAQVSLGSCTGVDRCRLIGVGLEVHNTTAEIYKQGSVTVAQLPDISQDQRAIQYLDIAVAGGYGQSTFQADQGPVMASTSDVLRRVPGAQTWEAAHGIYVIPRMVNPSGDVCLAGQNNSTRVPIFYDSNGTSSVLEPSGYSGGVGLPSIPQFRTMWSSGFSPTEAIFSGLSNQTTLTVTFRTIVEYFPSCVSVLLPMAEPSPGYDPLALEIYSNVIRTAPYAVPVGENAGGDYFRKIMRVLSQTLELTSPIFGSLSPLAAAAGKVGQKVFAEKPQQAPPPKKVDQKSAGNGARQTRRR